MVGGSGVGGGTGVVGRWRVFRQGMQQDFSDFLYDAVPIATQTSGCRLVFAFACNYREEEASLASLLGWMLSASCRG